MSLEFFNKIHFKYLIKIKGYKEITFEKRITNGMFKVFLQEDTNTVIKIFRKDNPSSNKFYWELKRSDNHTHYTNTLTHAKDTKIIGQHISKASRILKSGGYEAPYISGDNLEVLKLQIEDGDLFLDVNESQEILEALETLRMNLIAYYKKYRCLTGDWMLYNLVYDQTNKMIVNVDLEGFYTWKENQITNNLERIKSDLEDVKTLILDTRQEAVQH